ncbi:hypothetical protein LY76DRAFT_36531 [Colletotrichum caudatum]|nr:hypothetical protein LY76DRAFT_36531 [Colletotrichum caudatum]
MVGAYDGPSSLVLAPAMRDITIIPMASRAFSRSPYRIGHRTQLPSSPHGQATQATEAHHAKGLGPRHGSIPRVRRHLILLLKPFPRPSHCNLREHFRRPLSLRRSNRHFSPSWRRWKACHVVECASLRRLRLIVSPPPGSCPRPFYYLQTEQAGVPSENSRRAILSGLPLPLLSRPRPLKSLDLHGGYRDQAGAEIAQRGEAGKSPLIPLARPLT